MNFTTHQTANPAVTVRETRDGRANGDFHVFLRGYYHCTCVSLEEALRVAAERFPA